MRILLIGAALVSSSGAAQALERRLPTVEEMMRLRSVGFSTAISPDGRRVAYTVWQADFRQDTFVEQIWLADLTTGKSAALTAGERSFYAPQWSPDGTELACLSAAAKGGRQLFLISPEGGMPLQITDAPAGVQNYAWSPDGKTIAFASAAPEPEYLRDRRTQVGSFLVVGKDQPRTLLWAISLTDARQQPGTGRALMPDADLSVEGFSWSPDGSRLSFSASRPSRGKRSVESADVYVLSLSTGQIRPIVSQPGRNRDPAWSPDGQQILFTSDMGRKGLPAYNYELAVVSAEGGNPRSLTTGFDENPRFVAWIKDGIYFWARQRTAVHLFRLTPGTGRVTRVTQPDALMGEGFSLSRDGKRLAFTAASPSSLAELFVADLGDFAPRKLTDMTAQVDGLALSRPEVISWRNQEGIELEGVLLKPRDFNPKRKHPLLVVVHGGPAESDQPRLGPGLYYPLEVWAARGALVLRVNYRGSSGYGRKFRLLDYRSFGTGDAADVLSGIDHLVRKGWVDPKRIGCMGWSHGGYLTAFLAVTTSRFAAVSVGASVADWALFYYSSPALAEDYHGARPLDDPAIYRGTSVLAHAKGARTPTLIQHGELDRAVGHAYALRQVLVDQGVPVELIIYRGEGHNLSRPSAQRSAAIHNLLWFNHYLWDDPLPDLNRALSAVQGQQP